MPLTNPLASAIVTDRVRYEIHDISTGAYRWADAELFRWLNDAVRIVCFRKPHMYIDSSGLQATGIPIPVPTDVTALTDKININPMANSCLTHYVCAQAFFKDNDVQDKEQAGVHLKLFYEEMALL